MGGQFAVALGQRKGAGRGIQPFAHGVLGFGEFVVQQRKPCGVAVHFLKNQMLAKHAFKRESESQGGLAGAHVAGVAFPFQSAIAEGECGLCEQERGFGVCASALSVGGVPDVSDFN